jgi:adenylate cyclase
MTRIIYQPDGPINEDDLTLTVLEISRKHGIPHTSACGGHARCSTCRVLILDGAENVLPRNDAEQRLAALKGFEPDVRLACQSHLRGPVTLRRLVFDEDDRTLASVDTPRSTGREETLAVLFSDIRDFTPFAESHLPYDVVHVLNRYFYKMSEAVLARGGVIDKYIGDGLMAVFGCGMNDPAGACRQAVQCGLDMLAALAVLNQYVTRYFGTALEIGIGVHVGDAIVGEIGHPSRMQFTAIGDTVNVASRIESATKELGARLLVSKAVREQLAGQFVFGKEASVTLKGKSEPTRLYEVVGAAG